MQGVYLCTYIVYRYVLYIDASVRVHLTIGTLPHNTYYRHGRFTYPILRYDMDIIQGKGQATIGNIFEGFFDATSTRCLLASVVLVVLVMVLAVAREEGGRGTNSGLTNVALQTLGLFLQEPPSIKTQRLVKTS